MKGSLKIMPTQLRIIPAKCTNCKSCELVCSLVNDGVLNPSRSRITVIGFLEGKYSLPYNFPSTCKQCADAPCMAVCPVAAIARKKDKMKTVVIDAEICIDCKECIKACPFAAMLYDAEKKLPYKCELCGGKPACVPICPADAIEFVNQKAYFSQVQAREMEAYSILSRRNRN
jgi:Fe-S-cluster-containing dehydrogenase component